MNNSDCVIRCYGIAKDPETNNFMMVMNYYEFIGCYIKKSDSTIYPELKLSEFFLAEIDDVVESDVSKKHGFAPARAYSDLYQLMNYLWNHNQIDIEKF